MTQTSEDLPHPYFRPDRPGSVPLIGAKELARLLGGPDSPLLLDVRPTSERSLARLSAPALEIPYSELPRRLPEVPRDRPVVVVSHFGDQARRAAAYLERAGLPRVAALEGGIDEFARIVDPSIARYEEVPTGELVVEQLPRPETGCLAYLIGDPSEREALLIDPGREVDGYFADLTARKWKLVGVVETHTHADHLAGHSAVAQRSGAPIYLSHRSPASYPHRNVSDGETIPFGQLQLRILETPGHTRDHLSLHVADKVFTGDTLLLGSCGRTDLGDGSPELLWWSLQDRLLRLPADTEVYPAHYGKRHALPERYASTIGFERGNNEALLLRTYEEFLRYMTEGWPPKPADFDRIVGENLAH